jgi:1-acyl-sn-glycerol-3-phosphate acyltransferase
MSTNAFRESKWGRRSITLPAVWVGAVVAAALSIVALPLALVFDLLRGRPKLPTARVYVFGLTYLAWELLATGYAGVLWVASGFGLLLRTRQFQRLHQRFQVLWAASHIRTMRSVLGLRLEVDGAEHLAPGPVVLFSRHASMVDTLIPIHLAASHGLACRYVLKNELLWDPALDVVGHRFPNYFVDRSGGSSREVVEEVGKLAAGTRDDEAFVIFPEGSRFTPAKRERAIEKLSESSPDVAERARKLTRTMPPRTGGPIAALERAPKNADVVFLAHTGLEGLAGPKDMWKAVPFRHPVRVGVWRVARSEVPDGPDAQLAWLYERWTEVDTWVGDHAAVD